MSNQFEISLKRARNAFFPLIVFTLLSLMVFSCVETNDDSSTDPPVHHGQSGMGHDGNDKWSDNGNAGCAGFFGESLRLLPLDFSGYWKYPTQIFPTNNGGHTHRAPSQSNLITHPRSVVVPVLYDLADGAYITNPIDVNYQVSTGSLNTISTNTIDSSCNGGTPINLSQNIEALVLQHNNFQYNTQSHDVANFDAAIDIGNLDFEDHEYGIIFHFITDDPRINHTHCTMDTLYRKICYKNDDLLFDYPGLVQELDKIIDAKDKEKGQRKFKIESSENGIEIKKFQ